MHENLYKIKFILVCYSVRILTILGYECAWLILCNKLIYDDTCNALKPMKNTHQIRVALCTIYTFEICGSSLYHNYS